MSAAREPAQKAYGKEHDNDLNPAREYQADNGREYEYSKAQIAAMLPEMTHKFRCRDAHGITYFWGVCSESNSTAPLDCVGADHGCTEIQYKNPKTGKYETL